MNHKKITRAEFIEKMRESCENSENVKFSSPKIGILQQNSTKYAKNLSISESTKWYFEDPVVARLRSQKVE